MTEDQALKLLAEILDEATVRHLQALIDSEHEAAEELAKFIMARLKDNRVRMARP